MKKIIILSISLILMGSVVFAQNTDSGAGVRGEEGNANTQDTDVSVDSQLIKQKEEVQVKNQGEEQQIRTKEWVKVQVKKGVNIMEQVKERAGNVTELKEMIQVRKIEIEDELGNLDDTATKVYTNQNKVREAVHTLLISEDLIGGIGSEVSVIAKEFNNSIVATVQAEEKIQKRNTFMRFFFGGDEEAATELEGETTKNQERIQKLNQLREDCDCEEGVKEVIKEQIQTMEQEQERLEVLAEKEKKSSGIFGWVKNIFRFRR